MKSHAHHLAILVATLGILACDKTAKVGADTPTAPAASKEPVTSPSAIASAASTPVLPTIAPPPAADAKRLATSSNALGFDIYGKVRGAPGNLAISPASISAALAMTYGGARAQTEAQMKRVMHLEGARDAVMTDWGALSRSLQSPNRPVKLRIANRLFGEKTYTFDQGFLDRTRDAYGAPLEPTDFKEAFEPARARINGWVEDQTEKRIKDLLPVRALDATTRLVLVNAIYFLADWAEPFEKMATRDQPFKVTPTAPKATPMMHHDGSHRFAQTDGVKVLELPYQGGESSMLFILPDREDGLEALESSLSAAKLAAWTAALGPRAVAVTLPRFEVSPTPSLSLGSELVKLGMVDAFDKDKADFTGIANPKDARERLYIAKVFHKAFVKVDEKGTEAAAATAVVMAKGGGGPPARPALEFTADRPFLFLIMEKASGLVLFVGRVADPTVR